MCGIVGYVGSRPCKELLLQGLERLEYRGYDSAGICLMNGQVDIVRRVGKVSALRDAVGSCGPPGDDGPGAHPLGHARRRHRGQRAPDRGLRGLGRDRRPQRHHRELRDAPARALRRGARVPLRHRLRGDRAPDRGVLLRRPGRGRPRGVRPPRRPLRVRRRPPRQPRHPRRRPARLPARRRRGGGRDVHGVGHPGVPQLDAAGAVRARRRDRGRPPRRRDVPVGRRAPSSSAASTRSTGTRRRPRSRATRRSC